MLLMSLKQVKWLVAYFNLAAFSGCIAFSCGASIGIQQLALKSKMNPKLKAAVLGASNVIGVIAANNFNLFSTRYKDFISGI